MNAAEEIVALSDGERTTLRRHGARGPLVVGVHGLGASRYGWDRVAQHLASRYRFVAYDQRGHGDSPGARDVRLARSIEDCRDVLAALGEPVHALVGHSWGGAVVIGAGRGLEAGRVVAIDPLLRAARGVWSESVLPEFRRQLAPPLPERERAIRAENAALPEVEIAAKLHATRRLRIAAIEAVGAENGIDEGRWSFLTLLDDYPRPLLIAVADPRRTVFGEDDQARERGGRNVRIAAFPGASHSLQRDAFDRFAPELEAFLAGR